LKAAKAMGRAKVSIVGSNDPSNKVAGSCPCTIIVESAANITVDERINVFVSS
jgi:hypothetical protein